MILSSLAIWLALQAASAPTPGSAAHTWWQAHQSAILQQFTDFLSIPNVATDKANIGRNADWIADQLKQRGVSARLLTSPDAPPVVYGELATPGARQTVVIYAHYDGQPVEPAKWTRKDPFKPYLAGEASDPGHARIYGRSASDDKGVIIAQLAALDALKAAGLRPKSNLKFFYEGEEEQGSPHMEAILSRYRDLLGGDLWVFCDGPVHQSGRQQIVFGARGVTGFEVTLYGPRRELHSGHYGNWAPNPAMELAQLLAGMKDANGHVTIQGFYDGIEPLGDVEKRAIASAPNIDGMLKQEMGIGWTEGNGARLDELLQLPSLNIRGLLSSSVGATARNVIPSEATASIDIRLVKGLDAVKQVQKVVDHIRKQGYFVMDNPPDDEAHRQHDRIAYVNRKETGYNAQRTPMDLPISRQLVEAVRAARGEVVLLPTSGGSLPLIVFEKVLKAPVIVAPIANYDNNQHSHDENLRLQNLWDGIETMAAILAM
jgi:acetylornithine deacetylase/succinyl-diaminopimelate desuccinylase-like protein